VVLLAALATACDDGSPTDPGPPDDPDPPAAPDVLPPGFDLYTYEVVATYPHDPQAFTQGLVLDEGVLYEGTGIRGRSELRRVELETGTVLQSTALDDALFGEGITVVEDRIVQLTWTSGSGFVYDRESFARTRTFRYPGEGWGLTHDGTQLIMSDGTSSLFLLDLDTFERRESVAVTDDGEPVNDLNELEYIQGKVFANVWQTDRIAVIELLTGEVEAWIDLSGLLPPEDRAGANVLNGIAWDPSTGHLLVTGKLWPTLFEIRLVPVR
jgi:glutamine cyclotransferase